MNDAQHLIEILSTNMQTMYGHINLQYEPMQPQDKEIEACLETLVSDFEKFYEHFDLYVMNILAGHNPNSC